MSGDPITTAYWWRDVENWGDLLAPLLLERFAHVEVSWALPAFCEVASLGSILGNWIQPDYKGVILGSGKLLEHSAVPLGAKILALRGPLTAAGVPGLFALGDPGLLADELLEHPPVKKHNLGIVAHWSDHSLSVDPRFTPYDPLIIHAWDSPLSVVAAIGSCRKIVSSSLHGLILADAFNIPRRFEPSANWTKEGGHFKVRDHNAAVGVPFEIGLTQQALSQKVDDLKSGLWDAFEQFGQMIRARS